MPTLFRKPIWHNAAKGGAGAGAVKDPDMNLPMNARFEAVAEDLNRRQDETRQKHLAAMFDSPAKPTSVNLWRKASSPSVSPRFASSQEALVRGLRRLQGQQRAGGLPLDLPQRAAATDLARSKAIQHAIIEKHASRFVSEREAISHIQNVASRIQGPLFRKLGLRQEEIPVNPYVAHHTYAPEVDNMFAQWAREEDEYGSERRARSSKVAAGS